MPSAAERTRAWKIANRAKVLAAGALYRERNREKIRASASASREKRAQYARAIRLADPEAWKAKKKSYDTANAERIRAWGRARKQDAPVSYFMKHTRRAAKKATVAFDLDRAWFEMRLGAGVCEMSGLSFEFGRRNWNAPSVDRIDPKGPYTKDNCRLVLWALNAALSDRGEGYMLAVFRAIFIRRGEMIAWPQEKSA